jgi:phospholipase C
MNFRRKSLFLPVLFCLVALISLWAACNGTGGVKTQPPPPGLGNIKHIVFIIKENRSFDQYFGTFPGADGATSGKTSTGATIPLGHTLARWPMTLATVGLMPIPPWTREKWTSLIRSLWVRT